MKNNAKTILIFAAILILTITFLPIHSYASWKQDDGDWRYEENGKWVTDWKKIGGKWYYFDENGYMLYYGGGLYFVKGKPYYFDSEGAMRTGWIGEKRTNGTVWYYADTTSGILMTGWKKIDGVWYWFDDSYEMACGGTAKINGKLWVFNNSGALVQKAGWVNTKTGWYYANSDGTAFTGWKYLNKKWYYLEKSQGKMVTGGQVIDGVLYAFNSDGVLTTTYNSSGWRRIDGKWYYTDSNNKGVTGWKEIDGRWYYFESPSGVMLSSCCAEIKDRFYFFTISGSLASEEKWYGWKHDGRTSWYYTNSSGECVADSWKKIDGKWYYFDEWAEMIDDEYYLPTNGVSYDSILEWAEGKFDYFLK